MSNTHFIKKILFNKEFRSYDAERLLEFRPGINLIVGDQGCGKSSLFYAIMNWQESGIAMDYDPKSSYRFMDTEFMNPRLSFQDKYHRGMSVKEYDSAKYEHVKNQLIHDLTRQSHGESLLPMVLGSTEGGVTYFIDEPESGMSIRSQYKILEHFRNMSEHSQLIIATHSQVLINGVDEVLSLEHFRWMSPEEFINTQRK